MLKCFANNSLFQPHLTEAYIKLSLHIRYLLLFAFVLFYFYDYIIVYVQDRGFNAKISHLYLYQQSLFSNKQLLDGNNVSSL